MQKELTKWVIALKNYRNLKETKMKDGELRKLVAAELNLDEKIKKELGVKGHEDLYNFVNRKDYNEKED